MTCIIGKYCHRHDIIHGAEAEELRAGIEKLLVDHPRKVPKALLQRLLDTTDARDSLAYLEAEAASEAVTSDLISSRKQAEQSELARCKRVVLEQANKLRRIDHDMFGMWMPKRLRAIEAALRDIAK